MKKNNNELKNELYSIYKKIDFFSYSCSINNISLQLIRVIYKHHPEINENKDNLYALYESKGYTISSMDFIIDNANSSSLRLLINKIILSDYVNHFETPGFEHIYKNIQKHILKKTQKHKNTKTQKHKKEITDVSVQNI